MKQFLTITTAALALSFYGQDKYSYTQYNKLTEVKGTEFVIASVENYGKGFFSKGERLLFVNTTNGQTKETDYPYDAQVIKVEQIKLDTFKVNCVLVFARTVNLNRDNGIGWKDPEQVFIYSPDGQKMVQTDNKFFARSWTVNNKTGTVVIAGQYDSNNNGELDKNDRNEILILDLRTYKFIGKI